MMVILIPWSEAAAERRLDGLIDPKRMNIDFARIVRFVQEKKDQFIVDFLLASVEGAPKS